MICQVQYSTVLSTWTSGGLRAHARIVVPSWRLFWSVELYLSLFYGSVSSYSCSTAWEMSSSYPAVCSTVPVCSTAREVCSPWPAVCSTVPVWFELSECSLLGSMYLHHVPREGGDLSWVRVWTRADLSRGSLWNCSVLVASDLSTAIGEPVLVNEVVTVRLFLESDNHTHSSHYFSWVSPSSTPPSIV